MGEVAGSGGSVSFTNFQTSVKSFTIDHKSDVEEITDFADGSSGYKKYLPTLKDWTATVEMSWDSGNTATPGTTGTVTFNVNATSKYTGSGILTGITINEPVSGVVTCTGTFQGNGALTLT